MTIGPLPRMAPKKIGELQVSALVDSVGAARGVTEMMLNSPDDIISDNSNWLIPDLMDPETERLILSYQSFVLQKDGKSILIDAAIGEDGNFPARPDWHHTKSDWLNQLGKAGLAPEDLDIVFMTHLHMDHTGWLTRWNSDEWIPTFPNARHFVSKVELDYWIERHSEFPYMSQSIPDCVLPVLKAGLFEYITPGEEILEGLSVIDLAGHSPGMIGLEYRENDQLLAAFCADLMHHPLQMTVPSMSTMFCSDPNAAAETRISKLEEYARNKTAVFCGHFPGESAGHVAKTNGGYHFWPIV